VENSNYPSNIYTEELLNSFPYNYPRPKEGKSIGLHLEAAISPWDDKRKLIHIGINSIKEEKEENKNESPKNIVFAIDTSGSMGGSERIDLAKNSLKTFIQGLNSKDNVATIEYTDDAKISLPPTGMNAKNRILDSISRLKPTGGTNAWHGILLAYKLAREMRSDREQTKVIIVTDGDFGGVNNDELLALIQKENKAGITFSVFGFSTSGKVAVMDLISTTKAGEAYYINSPEDARKSLTLQSWLTYISLAKDMSIEVKFNPGLVESFRLIGFEKYRPSTGRKLYQVSSSFSYTALYEVITFDSDKIGELATVKLNYKTTNGKSEEIKEILFDSKSIAWDASENFRFAAGVAGLGMILNHSIYKGSLDFNMVIHLIQSAILYDPDGTRKEFLNLLNKLKKI
jgi:Ca-activated chloride channel family protein